MIEMKNNNEWKKRRIRYMINNNVIGKIFMRLYYKFEELIWLGVCIGMLVVVLKIMLSSGVTILDLIVLGLIF